MDTLRSHLLAAAVACLVGSTGLFPAATAAAGFPHINTNAIEQDVQQQLDAGVPPEDLQNTLNEEEDNIDITVDIERDPEASETDVDVDVECEITSFIPLEFHCVIIISITIPADDIST